MRVLYTVLISYTLFAEKVNLFKFAKELRMAKPEVGIQYTLPLDGSRTQHNVNARDRAMEAFILDRFRQGDISAGRAERLLNIPRESLSELIYKIKPKSPFLTRLFRQKS